MRKLCTLEELSISYEELNSVWKCDKRYGADILKHFIALNGAAFDFMGIRANIEVSLGNKARLQLITSHYAGTVPLLSPRNGKPYADLTIRGRFGENISGLLTAVQDSLLPEYNASLPDIQDSTVEPPFYFECCRFIDLWQRVERSPWCKFEIMDRERDSPTSGTRWEEYARRSFSPEMMLKYPTRENKLSKSHGEFRQLVLVLLLAISEVQRIQTPIAVRARYLNEIARLSSRYERMPKPRMCNVLVEHASDPIIIREAKRLANVILQNQRTRRRPWRVDYSALFEHYVQHLFKEVALKKNYAIACNPHYSISGRAPAWTLRYLEPDLVICKGNCQYVIDAKYKSHMFNQERITEDLKETFRHDLHQILAYSSFGTALNKRAILVYPASHFISKGLHISNPLTKAIADVHLVGIPLELGATSDTRLQLEDLIERSLSSEDFQLYN